MDTNKPLALVSSQYDDGKIFRNALSRRLGDQRVTLFQTTNDYLIASDAMGSGHYAGLIIEPLTKAIGGKFQYQHSQISSFDNSVSLESYLAKCALAAVSYSCANLAAESPIVVLSVLDAEGDAFVPDARNSFLKAGATAFETKPASVDAIAAYFR